MNLERFKTRKRLQAALAVLLIVSVALIIGIPGYSAKGTCYVKKTRCHGLPVDGCIGVRSRKTDFVPRQECGQLQNITSRCNRVGEEIAAINNGSIGTRWAPLAEVEGKTCERWHEAYGINLTSY